MRLLLKYKVNTEQSLFLSPLPFSLSLSTHCFSLSLSRLALNFMQSYVVVSYIPSLSSERVLLMSILLLILLLQYVLNYNTPTFQALLVILILSKTIHSVLLPLLLLNLVGQKERILSSGIWRCCELSHPTYFYSYHR